MACIDSCFCVCDLWKYISNGNYSVTQANIDCETSVGQQFLGLSMNYNELRYTNGYTQVPEGGTFRIGTVQDSCFSSSECSCRTGDYSFNYKIRPFLKINGRNTDQISLTNDSDGSIIYVRMNEIDSHYYVWGDVITFPSSSNADYVDRTPFDLIKPLNDDIKNYFKEQTLLAYPGYSFRSFYMGFSNYDCQAGVMLVDFEGDETDCTDLRSSGSSESCHIILSTNDPSQTDFAQVTREFDLLFQPDTSLGVTSGEITFGGGTSDYLSFSAMYNAGARFDSTVSPVRGEGTITVYAKIHADCFVAGFETPIFGFMPYTGVKTKDTDEFILAQFVFNDPCCHVPTGFSSEKDTVLQELVNWANTLGASTVTGGYIELTKVKWSGFERLTDYCCDESECSEYTNNDLSIDLTFPCNGGSSGGGNVDITCICDELAKINQRLSVLNDRLLGITTAIEEKELTVTVEPSSATVENTIQVEPTPITVNPSAVNPTIQVNPTPITVNPSAVNPTIQVNPTPITVEPSSATVQVTNNNSIDGLMCDDESLACILKNALNHDDESISKIIKDKDTSSFVDVTVEPNELVNIRKVHYSGFEDE